MSDSSAQARREEQSLVVTRLVGQAPPEELKTPFRRVTLERIARPDGTLLLRWPEDVCRLTQGTASKEAGTNIVVDNVADWLGVWARVHPEKVFIAERRAGGAWLSLTYRLAMDQVVRIGAELLKRCSNDSGSEPAPLAILSTNSLRQALLTLAALYTGIPVAPISPAYTTSGGNCARLRFVLGKLGARLVYSEEPDFASPALKTLGFPLSSMLTSADIDQWILATTEIDTMAVDRAHALAKGDRTAKVMFTSGSTGSPKGVVMTHSMLASAQATSAAVMDRLPTTPQVYLEWLPWHHVMGGNVNMHRTLRWGATAYLDDGRPVAGKFAQTLANLREISPTFYFNVPLGYAMLVPALERDPELARCYFAKLEYMSFGGASLPADMVERLDRLALAHVGKRIPITSGYGATETSGPALGTNWDTDSAGAVGLPAPGVTVKLLPLGDRYEMRLAGGNMMSRYLDEAALTEAAFDQAGFYRIGDAVQWADPGDPLRGLRFAGRVSEDFKLTSGTWVNAGSLRVRVVSAFAPLFRDAVITGHDREFVAAMGFIDEKVCRELCGADDAVPVTDLLNRPALLAWLADRLGRMNEGVQASSQRVERVLLLDEPPQAEAFEITDKGYVNQRAVIQRRSSLVATLHAEALAPGVVATVRPSCIGSKNDDYCEREA